MEGLFSGYIVAFTVFCFMVASVKLEDDINAEYAKDIAETPGLRQDKFVFGYCNFGGKNTTLKLYKKQVEAAIACKAVLDYKCNKACQYEKIGISDAEGNVDRKKFETHLNLFMAGQHQTITKIVVDASLECLVINGIKSMLSTTNCTINTAPMGCVVMKYYKLCRPGEKLPPGLARAP